MTRFGKAVRNALLVALGLVVFGGTAVWGFYVHRNHAFPYRLGRFFSMRVMHVRDRFGLPRSPLAKSAPSLQQIERLARLPYLQGYREAGTNSSVIVHDPVRAADGWNLFISGHKPQLALTDMDGRVLKTWTTEVAKALPGVQLRSWQDRQAALFFRSALLLPGGDAIGMFHGLGLVRLGPDSEVKWGWSGPVHHDLWLADDQSIWTLTHKRRPPLADFHPHDWVWEDFVAEVSPDGRLRREISILESFRRSAFAPMLTALPPDNDILHANSLQVFDGSLAGRSPLFRRGNVLISMRDTEVVAILDPESEKIVWTLTGLFHRQHYARLLPNGHLILFDNLGTLGPTSRVLEIDPFTQEVVWEFGGRPGQEFFSATNGFVRRLANGNTLVGSTNEGRVLEVTPDKQVVWDFINFNRTGHNGRLVASIYDLERVPKDFSFLGSGSEQVSAASW